MGRKYIKPYIKVKEIEASPLMDASQNIEVKQEEYEKSNAVLNSKLNNFNVWDDEDGYDNE